LINTTADSLEARRESEEKKIRCSLISKQASEKYFCEEEKKLR